LRKGFPGHFKDYLLPAFDPSCSDDIADHNAILVDADPIVIGEVLDYVVEEGLQVEEDGERLGGDIIYVVELLKTVLFDIVGSVYGKTLVVVRYVTGLPRNQVQTQKKVTSLALKVLQRSLLVHST
jgi:hypothetical protein